MSRSSEPHMSQSVFKIAQDLVDRAGVSQSVLASLEPTGQKINFNPTSAIDRECQMNMDLLRHGLVNRWFTTSQSTDGEHYAEPKDADVGVDIPLVRLGKALSRADVAEYDGTHSSDKHLAITNYVVMVQGASGAGLQKVLICQGPTEAGNAIFHEALNGYSVVFCAAILERAAKFILRLSTRDPERLLKTVRFSRVPIQIEQFLVSRREGYDSRSMRIVVMNKITNVDIEKGHLTIGYIN